MWRIVLITALLQVTWGFSRPAEPIEGPLWYFNAIQLPRHSRITLSDMIKQRLPPYKTNEEFLDQNFPRKSEGKRAFSILARLRPFSDIGKQRTSIRQASRGPAPLTPLSDLDLISAETRAMLRPIGQPLRWG